MAEMVGYSDRVGLRQLSNFVTDETYVVKVYHCSLLLHEYSVSIKV